MKHVSLTTRGGSKRGGRLLRCLTRLPVRCGGRTCQPHCAVVLVCLLACLLAHLLPYLPTYLPAGL